MYNIIYKHIYIYIYENDFARYMLKQLLTTMSANSVDIHLAASRLGKYPPLFTFTLVNNCSIYIERDVHAYPLEWIYAYEI